MALGAGAEATTGEAVAGMTEGVGATVGARGTTGALTAGQTGAGAFDVVTGAFGATEGIGDGCGGFVGGAGADAGTKPVGACNCAEVPDEVLVPF